MSHTTASLLLPPVSRAAGTVRLPGSKSISNRCLLLAALARGTTTLRGVLDADDTRVMRDALTALGIRLSHLGAAGGGSDDWQVEGAGSVFPVKQADLFLGNAGTAIRPLTAALALSGGEYTVRGVPRMHERPIGDLVDALRAAGAAIDCTQNEGYPPLAIHPALLRNGLRDAAIRVRGDVSSQFLTALLMALPLTGRESHIEVVGELISKPYIEITLKLMQRFGLTVTREGWSRFHVPPGPYIAPGELHVEGDASGASYFLAAGLLGGGPVRVEGVDADSIQGDIAFADALRGLGATITSGPGWLEASGSGSVRAFDADLNHIPDAAMTLAVCALRADGPCRLRNIGSWRVKETDRIHAMATELRKVGAMVEEGPDWLRITPPATLNFAAVDTYDDHRMAMCFSLVALMGAPVRIVDPGCTAKTYPGYFDDLNNLLPADELARGTVPVIAIDGTAASGKGTIAQRVAAALGWAYLDSGALYRVVGHAAETAGIDLDDGVALAALACRLDIRFAGERIMVDGADVSAAVRSAAAGTAASRVAVHPALRAALLQRQRAFRNLPGLVADGRDMGSVVFSDARLKIYLTASVAERARRRHLQLQNKTLNHKGDGVSLAALEQELAERDARDASRLTAPLKVCPGAVVIDSTELGIDAVVDRVMQAARDAGLV
ncbi:MAG: 3-phosphoshikimate 1-carboxyvinyltransferase [Rhodocyclaceae bacterium]|nr:3-phosphoshikimate 1-carboxyvinyltransferase [Rhodocyclaceae bacterium]